LIIWRQRARLFPPFDLDDYFQPGECIMGFIKFTKGTSLSDKDRKALRRLLTDEKRSFSPH